MTDIVTCIQERLNNSTLTVRYNGTVIGHVLHDSDQTWLATEPPPPEQNQGRLKTMTEAVDWLVAQAGPQVISE